MRGRKPKPTHLKLVTGNPGGRPLNTREPSPDRSGIPEPPAELADDAKAEWDRVSGALYQIGILTSIDRAALAAYCQAYGRWVQAERTAAGRLLVKTTNGNVIQNPLIGIANKAMRDMVKYAAEFGMTPSARSRMIADPAQFDEDPAEKYFK